MTPPPIVPTVDIGWPAFLPFLHLAFGLEHAVVGLRVARWQRAVGRRLIWAEDSSERRHEYAIDA